MKDLVEELERKNKINHENFAEIQKQKSIDECLRMELDDIKR